MKKYELVEIEGSNFYRIKAIKDFANVKAGDLGGYVESEYNLSQEGDCWIYDDAVVRDKAIVIDDAIICNKAIVCDRAAVWGKSYCSRSCYSLWLCFS